MFSILFFIYLFILFFFFLFVFGDARFGVTIIMLSSLVMS